MNAVAETPVQRLPQSALRNPREILRWAVCSLPMARWRIWSGLSCTKFVVPPKLVGTTSQRTWPNTPRVQLDLRKVIDALNREPLREGEARGVAMPMLKVLYAIMLKATQWGLQGKEGMVKIPAAVDHTLKQAMKTFTTQNAMF
nr:hypothetical protein CFP56_31606 [Quercus suber]